MKRANYVIAAAGLATAGYVFFVFRDARHVAREAKAKELDGQTGKECKQPRSLRPPAFTQVTPGTPEHPGMFKINGRSDAPPGFVLPNVVFDKEDRNEKWAAPVETYLAKAVGPDLEQGFPEVSNIQTECKSSTCKVSWTVDPSYKGSVKALYQKIEHYYMALYPNDATASGSSTSLVTRYEGGQVYKERKDPDKLIAEMKQHRQDQLKGIIDGRALRYTPPNFTAETWQAMAQR